MLKTNLNRTAVNSKPWQKKKQTYHGDVRESSLIRILFWMNAKKRHTTNKKGRRKKSASIKSIAKKFISSKWMLYGLLKTSKKKEEVRRKNKTRGRKRWMKELWKHKTDIKERENPFRGCFFFGFRTLLSLP